MMDRADRFFFALNGGFAVANFCCGNIFVGALNLTFALWLISTPLAERR